MPTHLLEALLYCKKSGSKLSCLLFARFRTPPLSYPCYLVAMCCSLRLQNDQLHAMFPARTNKPHTHYHTEEPSKAATGLQECSSLRLQIHLDDIMFSVRATKFTPEITSQVSNPPWTSPCFLSLQKSMDTKSCLLLARLPNSKPLKKNLWP
jgi:hypothetical protein